VSGHKANAVALLTHYFEQAGIERSADLHAELTDLVDSIVKAAVEEMIDLNRSMVE